VRPAYCEKHGTQSFVQTSPKLAEESFDSSAVDATDIRSLEIHSSGKIFRYVVDVEFLKGFMHPSDRITIILKDRDKALKQLNDRLLVQRITNEMKWICPLCLMPHLSRIGNY